MEIAAVESFAIKKVMEIAVTNKFQSIVIGTDSTVAGRAAAEGYSRETPIDEEVIYVSEFEGRIVMCDMRSEENVADIGTRPHKAYSAVERQFSCQAPEKTYYTHGMSIKVRVRHTSRGITNDSVIRRSAAKMLILQESDRRLTDKSSERSTNLY